MYLSTVKKIKKGERFFQSRRFSMNSFIRAKSSRKEFERWGVPSTIQEWE